MKTTKLLIIVLGLVLVMTSFVAAHTGEDDYAHHSSMMGGFYGDGMWIFGWIFMLLIVVALILFIAWLIKQIQEPRRRKR